MIAHCALSHIESREAGMGEARRRGPVRRPRARCWNAVARRFVPAGRPAVATSVTSPTVSERAGKISVTADIDQSAALSGHRATGGVYRAPARF